MNDEEYAWDMNEVRWVSGYGLDDCENGGKILGYYNIFKPLKAS